MIVSIHAENLRHTQLLRQRNQGEIGKIGGSIGIALIEIRDVGVIFRQ